MNKSKFLKKSLATLLAILMVVAMIPLSAAAAVPTLQYLYVNSTAVDMADGEADIAQTDTDVKLRLNAGAMGGKANVLVVKDDTVLDTSIQIHDSTDAIVKLADWDTDESADTVTLKIKVVNVNDETDFDEYSLVLNRTTKATDADIANAEPVHNTGSYKVTAIDEDNNIVYVDIARNATAPVIKVTAAGKATVNGIATEQEVFAKDGDTFQIVSESGNNKNTWTVKANKVDSFVSLSIDGVAGEFSKSSDAALYKDTVTVTLDPSVALDAIGDAQAVKKAIDFQVNGNVSTIKLEKSATSGDCPTDAETDAKYITTGETVYNFGTLTTAQGYKGTLTIPCVEGVAAQTYTLIVNLKKSDDTAITYAQFDQQIATIDGSEISAILPAKKADGTTATTLASVKVELKSAAASITGAGKTWTKSDDTFTANNVNLTSAKTITVHAEDGTVYSYKLSASISDNEDRAYLTSMWIQDPVTGYKDEAKIDTNARTITFEVPYMTIDMSDWKVYATPVAGATAIAHTTSAATTGVTVVNGKTTADKLGLTKLIVGDNKGYISAKNMNNDAVFTNYTVIVKLAKHTTVAGLNSITVSAQGDPAGTNSDVLVEKITDANTIVGKPSTADKKVTFTAPYSLYDNYMLITDVDYDGVLYLGLTDGAFAGYSWLSPVSTLVAKDEAFNSSYFRLDSDADEIIWNTTAKAELGDNGHTAGLSYVLIAAPEEIAREINKQTAAAGNYKLTAVDSAKCVVYDIDLKQAAPSEKADLLSASVKGTSLVVGNGKVTGTIPWSATTDTVPTNATNPDTANAQFVTFTVSDHAVLGSSLNHPDHFKFASNGDTDGDGAANAWAANNMKVAFVRNDDGTVTPYVAASNNPDGTCNWIKMGDDTYGIPANLTVWSEAAAALSPSGFSADTVDKGSFQQYTVDLKWAPASVEAKILSFNLPKGVTTITGDKINITVPYGTNLKSQIPTFTTSPQAKVVLKSNNNVVTSGKTTLDFGSPLTLVVTAEDGNHTAEYTVTVAEGMLFTDVSENDWFYDDVLTAAANEWIVGITETTFGPYGDIKRGDFALVVARILGCDTLAASDTSAFADVAVDAYNCTAINFCVEQGILSGFEDGNFKPDAPITREQAAKILAIAMELDCDSSVTATDFADDAKIADWAKMYVDACANAGIFNGDDQGNFNGTNNLTRAEAAAILVRAFA